MEIRLMEELQTTLHDLQIHSRMNSVKLIHWYYSLSMDTTIKRSYALIYPAGIKTKEKEASYQARFHIHCFSSLQHYMMLFRNHTESLHPSQQVDNSTLLLQLTLHWLFCPPCHPQRIQCWETPTVKQNGRGACWWGKHRAVWTHTAMTASPGAPLLGKVFRKK